MGLEQKGIPEIKEEKYLVDWKKLVDVQETKGQTFEQAVVVGCDSKENFAD